MRIQHNIMAMGAYRNYTNNVNAMKKNLERLSSGYKINRAGDDAAGLAISEKMRAQITGLETAQKNAKDGISLVQTAEGALTEVHDMLNRMVTLATQSANGTYDNETDRVQLQKELNQLRSEIDRIADSSNFNGIKLLDGSRAAQSTSALGSSAAQLLSGLDGSAPTKAGAAEITVNMKDGSAAAAEILKGTSTDGTNVIAGTMGTYEIKVGGQGAVTGGKIEKAQFEVTIGGKKANVADSNTTAANQADAWATSVGALTGFTVTGNNDGTVTITETGTDMTEANMVTALNALGFSVTAGNIGYTASTGAASTAKLTLAAPSTTKPAATTIADMNDADFTTLAAGDKITVTAGGKDYTYTATGAATAAIVTDLKTQMGNDGITLDNASGNDHIKMTAAQTSITGLKADAAGASAATVTAGTTKASELAEMYLDTTSSGVKIGDYFDVEVYAAGSTTKKTGDPVINNGDTIKLVAKYGGKLDGTDIDTDVTGLTISSNSLTNTALKGSISLSDGSDEGNAPVSKEVSRYTMTFDLENLHAGQSITIDDTTFLFVNKAGTAANSEVEIDLSKISDASGAAGDISKLIQDAITGTGGLETGTGNDWKVNADLTKTSADGKKFTLVLETADDKVGADDTNLGAGRVTVGIPASGRPPIDVAYVRAGYVGDSTQPTGDPFATATYKHDGIKNLDVGDKIYIGDAEIEVVADGTTNLTAKQITKSDATGTSGAANLAKIIEQQKPGFGQGKVKFDLSTGEITITGTEVGQTGAALKKQIGDVKFLDKGATTATASTATSSNDAMAITAGDTTISDLLGADLQGITGNKLGDIFDITVNGNAKEDDYVIQEGDIVKFTAKINGQLDDKVMANFNYSGDITSLTAANGYDEGSNASGNKTRYNLTIDLAAVAGGNSFTFGNVNGKSVTFDLSYDAKNTGNNTVGSSDKDDIADSEGTRVNINLYGKTTAQAQEEIYNQVAKAMGGDFTVSRATAGNKITLNLEAKNEGIDYNFGNIRYSSQSNAFSNPVYNPAGGSAGGVEGTHAKAVYKFDASQLQVGDVLSIGDAKVNLVDGETGTTSVGGKLQFNVNIADAKANPNGALTQMLESAGFQAGQVRFDTDNNTMTIEGKTTGQTSAELQSEIGSISLSSSSGRAMEKGGLKLQIGDTADTFNQLTVDIRDMHSAALGLDTISIADQDSAAKAVDVIKAAINTVSDVRGTLGATQNRLDHTINNLSVMTENIQDAESTIRDTDVADEMMAYTKNNILIQSAQAMLAQANQVPQGVLQLLG